MDEVKRFEVEREEEWRSKWVNEIPYLRFKADWDVKVIPPFSGAIARFWVEKGDKHVSVYLDCYECIGCFGEPYWEIYAYEENARRVAMNDTDTLMNLISEVVDV